MTDLLQPVSTYSIDPDPFMQHFTVNHGSAVGGFVLENHLVLEYVSQSGRKFGLFC